MTHRKSMIVATDADSACCREPTLEEILLDPVIKAVMQADAVDIGELQRLLAIAKGDHDQTDV